MHFFALGSHPELSIAEIEAVLGRAVSPSQHAQDLLLLEDAPLSAQALQDRLAGTIKIGSIVGSLKKWNKEEAADLITAMIRNDECQNTNAKCLFGISVYDKALRHHSEALGLEIKKRLKADGVSSRLVTSRDAILSSVVVEKNRLLESGGEFVLTSSNGEVLIGQTETVQNFEGWSERDFGRPRRNAKSGMLPPKLARILLNLSGCDPERSSVLDPFCGSGTVLMEASLLGFKQIYGSDLSERAIDDTESNLNWIMRDNGINESSSAFFARSETGTKRVATRHVVVELEVSDASALTLDRPVDAIVTEPFLGRPQKGGETEKQLMAIQQELLLLYEKTFSHLVTLLKPGGVLVATFPIIAGVPIVPKIKSARAFGTPFHYEREGQRVRRLIVRWKKT